MRVAVTGSKGFVGSLLVQKLKSIGIIVIEIDFDNGYDLTDWSSLSKNYFF